LRPAKGEGVVARAVDSAVHKLRNSYQASLEAVLGDRRATVATSVVVGALALGAVFLFTQLPRELVPNEDRGRVDISIQAPEGAGFDYTKQAADRVETRLLDLLKDGVIERYVVAAPRFGSSQFNTASGNVALPDERVDGVTSQDLAAELNKEFSSVTSARAIASVRPSIQRGGGGGGSNVDLIVSGNEYPEIARLIQPLFEAAQNNPGMTRARLDYEPTSPRLLVNIDREKAAALGVSGQAVGRALETMFGSRQVTTYIRGGQEYDVILQTDRAQRMTEADLEKLYVRADSGAIVPLSTVVTTEVRGDTPDRSRIDRQRSITLSVQLNPGYTVGEAVDFLQKEVDKQPTGLTVKWGGTARDYLEAGGAVGLAFALALLLVFL